MESSFLFCQACNAANRVQAVTCFACGYPLQGRSRSAANRRASHPGYVQGELLRQRYHIISQAGQGGFGAVYKAADTQFGNRLVAIKEMSQSALSPQQIAEATQAFKREALMLAGLNHPHLPSIYEHFIEGGQWYLVMDFIEGQTLEQYLKRVGTHSLSVEQVLDIGIQLCKVLGYLHTRHPPIIFRDLKPSNVMLTPEGEIYLIDFGIARHFKPGQVKDTIAFGSPGYAPPEQYGNTQTTPRADIYSLGALLHQMLTGHDPLSNTPNMFTFPPLRLHEQPAGLKELITRMLEMNPANRSANMAEVRRELQGIAADETARQRTMPDYRHSAAAVRQHSLEVRRQPPVGATLSTYRGHSPHHGYPTTVTSVTWSPDGAHIASASVTVRVWNALTGDTILSYRGHAGFQALVAAVAWSPDGALIASVGGGDEQAIHIWYAANGDPLSSYRGHTKQVNALAWSPDGAQIASASDTVQVWDAMALIREDARVSVIKYPGHTRFWRRNNAVHAIAWSPDGAYIASSGADKTVQVWHARQPFQHTILTYRRHTLPVYCVAWSPDGTLIASGSGDGTVQVWDSTTGELFFTYDGHPGSQVWINALAWAPDGMRIASASGGSDETVHVWNALDGGNVFRYSGHTDCTNALAWSPDGTRIGSASQDGSVHVWQAA